jgi:hypothetical protein
MLKGAAFPKAKQWVAMPDRVRHDEDYLRHSGGAPHARPESSGFKSQEKNSAQTRLSRAWTIVWLSLMAIRVLPYSACSRDRDRAAPLKASTAAFALRTSRRARLGGERQR